MLRQKPSFWNFLLTRNSHAKNLLLGLGFAFGWFTLLYYFSTSGTVPFKTGFLFSMVTSILLTTLALFPQWQQYTELASVFEKGVEIKGTIVNMYIFRGSGYISFEYQYQQQKYRSTDSVNRNRRTRDITVGQEVMLFVNPEKPTKAFIRDLYLNTF
jgi:hypothetical protein